METTIREEVHAMLRNRFPSVPFKFTSDESLVASLPAPYPELGTLEIHDDGTEAIAEIGNVTHAHFYPYDKKGPNAAAEIAEKLGEFLEELFADRIYMYATPHGGGSGPVTDKQPKPKNLCKPSRKYYLWSRPYS